MLGASAVGKSEVVWQLAAAAMVASMRSAALSISLRKAGHSTIPLP